jgi:hypothetical protein
MGDRWSSQYGDIVLHQQKIEGESMKDDECTATAHCSSARVNNVKSNVKEKRVRQEAEWDVMSV